MYEFLKKYSSGDPDLETKYFSIKYGNFCVESYCPKNSKRIATIISAKEGVESICLVLDLNQENKLEIVEETKLPLTKDMQIKRIEFSKKIIELEELILKEREVVEENMKHKK